MPATTAVALASSVAAGAVVGSAAGAALHRWPTGATLSEPRRSECDDCGVGLRARDLIPIVSWAVLRGRCRACGARIDPRLPSLEVAAAVITVIIVRAHGATFVAAVLAVGSVAVVLAAIIDLEHLIVPDRLTRPLAVFALLALPVLVGRDRVVVAVAWAVGVPLVLQVVSLVADRVARSRPIGGGDIKLLVGVLALSGVAPQGPPAVLLGSVVLAGSVATVGLITGRLSRRSRLPFAPAIAVPFLIVVMAPDRAVDIVTITGGNSWSV